MNQQTIEKFGRVASLDGLRALAILLVITFHLSLYHGHSSNPFIEKLEVFFKHAALCGIALFFILSGYLISTLIFREIKSRGSIDLYRFWVRRILRIWPLYFLALAMYCIAYRKIPSHPALWHFLTFTQNFASSIKFFIPSWTLAYEEQFYFIFPLLMLVVCKMRMPMGALRFFLIIFLIATCLFDKLSPVINICDSFILGILIGEINLNAPQILQVFQKHALMVLFVSFFLIYGMFFSYSHHFFYLVLSIALGFWIILCIGPHSFPGRGILESKIAKWIGITSYSTYLFHEAVFVLVNKYVNAAHYNIFYPLALFSALFFAIISYLAIERPILIFRDRKFIRK